MAPWPSLAEPLAALGSELPFFHIFCFFSLNNLLPDPRFLPIALAFVLREFGVLGFARGFVQAWFANMPFCVD